MSKIAVIGSGLSGLTAALYLAQKGHEVILFEQYKLAGGATASLKKERYTWDLGQLIIEGLGPNEPLGRILSELGINKLKIKVEDRGYVFPDFEINKPPKYEGFKWRINFLKKLFPEDSTGLDKYWKDFLHYTQFMTYIRKMESSKGIISFYWKIRLFIKLFVSGLFSKRNWSASKLMDYYFSNEKLQLVFISIIADFFTPPSKFPGLGVFSLNAEAIYDKRMPKMIEKNTKQLHHYDILGGVSKLVDILVEEFKNAGGTLKLNTEITKIIVKQNIVQGILDNKGRRVPFDIVIASGSAKKTFFDLVGKKNLSYELWSIINNLKLMESVFMVHLGLDNEYDPSEYNNNYVVRYYYQIDTTKELEESINDERNGSYHKGEKGFVVHIPTLHSPEMAPEGHHAMTIYTICPDKLREGSWSHKKEEYAHKLIQYAEEYFPNLHNHIEVQEIVTPEDFRERLNVDHHAFGGIAPYLGMVRLPHKTPINGLWFIGAESESGGGVNNVIPGAFKTAKIIDKYFS